MNSACLEGGGRDVRFARGPSNRAASSAVLGSGTSSSLPESTSKPVGREITTSAFLCRRHSWPVESLCGAGGIGNEETAELGVSGGSIGRGVLRRLSISKEETCSPTLRTLRPSRGEAGRRTSQCHPPSPTDFLTTPVSPMRELFVRLFPVTRTWSGGGQVRSSGGEMMIWTTGDDGFSNPPNRRRFWRAPRVVLVNPSRERFEGGRPRGGRGRMRGAARRVVFRYDAIDAEGPRGWGVATRVARAREETRGTERDKKRPARSAREEEETEASSDRWSPSGSPR